MTSDAKKYFIKSNGQERGPYTVDDFVSMVRGDQLKATDYVLDSTLGDWIMICQIPEFIASMNHDKPVSRVKTVTNSSQFDNTKWHIIKGSKNLGPFTYLEMVKMLQEKEAFEFDYVWREGMDSWMRIAERDEFGSYAIRELLNKSGDEEVFVKRKSNRFHYHCEVLVHNNDRVWKGHTVELSEAGASVKINHALIAPGQNIFIHFMAGNSSKPFNVLCEIVSKRYSQGIRHKDAPVIYGVKFVNIDKQEKEEIKAIKQAA